MSTDARLVTEIEVRMPSDCVRSLKNLWGKPLSDLALSSLLDEPKRSEKGCFLHTEVAWGTQRRMQGWSGIAQENR